MHVFLEKSAESKIGFEKIKSKTLIAFLDAGILIIFSFLVLYTSLL